MHVLDLEEHITDDFLLDPALIVILGPVIDTLYLDYTFHSNLTLHEQVDVGLVLLLPEKALIVVKDSLF